MTTESATYGPTYTERAETAISQVKDFKPADFIKDAKTISFAFSLFSAWARIADDTSSGTDDKEQEVRQRLIAALSAKQQQAFPILRDAYGPAMRAALWEADGKARTFGTGYRAIEFISGAFAANRNIKAFHEEITPTLLQLRFARAQYKWLDADVEYTYYTISPPGDGAVGVWNGSSFRQVQ